jgi:hypothetical protein
MTCISDELSSDESQCRPVTVRSGRLIEVGGRNALETFGEASMATDHALAKRLRELVEPYSWVTLPFFLTIT